MAAPVKKELVLGYSPYECTYGVDPFGDVFSKAQNVKTHGFEGVDAVVLWGGRDIHPTYYDSVPHMFNGASTLPSERDVFEFKMMLYCKANNIPIIGVCRGAQFLCAFAGGKLIQHTFGHNTDHDVDTIDGLKFKVTSSHHQMMYPFDVKHTMIAWAAPAKGSVYHGEPDKVFDMKNKDEPEIVYFPGVRGLAIQGHPEYNWATKDFVDYCNYLILSYLFPMGK